MDHYTVYKITNLVNGKYYVGKHICTVKCKHRKKSFDNLCCAYMGSGGAAKGGGFKAAKKKYGLENFKKEILFVFETEAEMNEKEAEIVTEELVASGLVYNLCPGGQGGFGYLNTSDKSNIGWKTNGSATAIERSRKGGIKTGDLVKTRWAAGVINEAWLEAGRTSFLGKKHSEETKEKMRQKAKLHQEGSKNSQFGTMWITNGIENKKIKKDLDIPEGWYKGRRIAALA